MVQWLSLRTSNARGVGVIAGRDTKIPREADNQDEAHLGAPPCPAPAGSANAGSTLSMQHGNTATALSTNWDQPRLPGLYV